jgi:hypothetical protein
VDVYANGNLIAQNFTFSQLTNYVCVQPGTYRITVYPTGTTVTPIIDTTVVIVARMIATIAITGLLANLALQIIPEPPTYVTYANSLIRLVHLSPNTPAIDLVVGDAAVLSNIAYGAVSEYATVPSASYVLQLRLTGTDQVVVYVPNIYLNSGRAYTVFAIGLAGGTPPLGMVVGEDANSYVM